MKFEEQKVKLKVKNFDFKKGNGVKFKHNVLLPNHIRSLIVGSSNTGKTNLLLTLLIEPNGVKFANVYLFSKSGNQEKYLILKEILAKVEGVDFFEYSDRILEPNELRKNSVVIFDDVMTMEQKPIQDIFSMGRHFNIDAFYLAQTYSKIPKQLVRDNANLIMLYKIDERNLRHVYDDHSSTDFSFERFKEVCGECWTQRFGFICINKDNDKNKGRYRKGLDIYIKLESN